jgi:lysozyme family protein
MTFEDAFPLVITLEGGYVNNPDDAGGETKFGISKAAYPNEDIKALTLDRAKAIYATDYWMKAGCDKLPDAVRYDVFDTAVNSGVGTAIKCLQRALGVIDDGALGPKTLSAATAMDAMALRLLFNAQRLLFVANSNDFSKFGKGWIRRIATVMGRTS